MSSDPLSLTSSQADKLRKDVVRLAQKRFEADWELMRKLWQVRFSKVENTPVYEGWGFSTFNEWVEEEIGISVAKAIRMSRVYYVFGVECEGLWEKKYSTMPYEKLVEMTGVVNRINCLTWMKFAHEHTWTELRDHVWEVEEGSAQPRHYRFTAGFKKTEINLVERGIAQARDLHDSKFRGELLAFIVGDWMKIRKAARK